MRELQPTHIITIRQYLIANGLKTPSVLDDFLDHFCCLVEEKMWKGQAFEEAFSDTAALIGPVDVLEIQKDTTYFLTIKSRIMLVKGIFITAFLSVFCYVFGSLMYGLLSMPPVGNPELGYMLQGLLRTTGLGIFCFGFLPFLFRFGYAQFVAKLQQ